MNRASDSVTVTIPRAIAGEIPSISAQLNERMHELLERNTEGGLNAVERAELETLVQMTQFAQLLAMAVHEAEA
jgi:hypothetical protein